MNCSRVFLFLFFLFFCFTQKAFSQKIVDLSFEFQAYPTGLIPGVSLDAQIGAKSMIYGRLGYNWIRHRGLGKHEDERGDGWGFSIGYKRAFKDLARAWQLGIKTDLWWNTIRWKDGNNNGISEIVVIQPTVELSYLILSGAIVFSPTVAFGYEVNFKTNGEETGEGAIILIGFKIGKRLQ